MKKNEVKHYSHKRSGVTFGFLLVLLGIIFLGFNFGILNTGWKQVIFSWQMLVIVIGLITLFHKHIFNGLALITIGGFFILPRLAIACPESFYWVEQDFTATYWPVLLIIAGIFILLQIIFLPKWRTVNHYTNTDNEFTKKCNKRYDYTRSGFERNSVFTNVEEIILEPEFKGGEFNAVFGGITLDLRKTSLPEGETKIEVNAVFGGVTLFIPENWNVELHFSSVFGAFQDNRMLSDDIDYSRKLVIVGSCVFGGGEIKN